MTIPISPNEFGAILRLDLTAFIEKSFGTVSPGAPYEPNWHVEAMAEKLRQVHAGECKRLLITMPPRYGKSITASVAFPAWVLGLNPACKFLVASYGGDLATKHAGDFRTLVRSPWYRAASPSAPC